MLALLLLGSCGTGDPSSGETTTLLARLDQVISPGKILKVADLSKEGAVEGVWYVDPTGKRLRHEETGAYTMGNVTVFDGTGHSSLSGADLTVTPHGGGGYDAGYDLLDDFANMEPIKTGTIEVKGQGLTIYELALPSPDPAHTYAARFYVDPSSGLRVKQEISPMGFSTGPVSVGSWTRRSWRFPLNGPDLAKRRQLGWRNA